MTRRFEKSLTGEEATRALARALGARLEGGEVIALVGDLGSGKTAFVRGLAEGLAIDPGLVYSPTFTLVAEYPGRIPLRHVDLYRLSDAVGFAEAEEIGLDDVLASPGVTAIEWYDRVDAELGAVAAATVRIAIGPGTGEEGRRIEIEGADERGAAIVEALERDLGGALPGDESTRCP